MHSWKLNPHRSAQVGSACQVSLVCSWGAYNTTLEIGEKRNKWENLCFESHKLSATASSSQRGSDHQPCTFKSLMDTILIRAEEGEERTELVNYSCVIIIIFIYMSISNRIVPMLKQTIKKMLVAFRSSLTMSENKLLHRPLELVVFCALLLTYLQSFVVFLIFMACRPNWMLSQWPFTGTPAKQ